MEPGEVACKVKKYSEILRAVDEDFPFYPEGWDDQLADTIADTLEAPGALLDGFPEARFFDPVSPYEIRPELRITPDLQSLRAEPRGLSDGSNGRCARP